MLEALVRLDPGAQRWRQLALCDKLVSCLVVDEQEDEGTGEGKGSSRCLRHTPHHHTHCHERQLGSARAEN